MNSIERSTDFQKGIPVYKFQVSITISVNSMNLPKVQYDRIEINGTL